MTENFRRISLECAPRTELHDALGLTGCEVSVNALPGYRRLTGQGGEAFNGVAVRRTDGAPRSLPKNP